MTASPMLDEDEQGLRADKAWNLPFSIAARTSNPVWSGLISRVFVFFAGEEEGTGEPTLLSGVDRLSGSFALPNFNVKLLLVFGSEDGGPRRRFRLQGAGQGRCSGSFDLLFFDIDLLLSVGSGEGHPRRVVCSRGKG